jgi:hypothetical protein
MIQLELPFSEEFACMTTTLYDSMVGVGTPSDTIPDDIDALKAALLGERIARREFEARASGAEAMVAHYKMMIARMKRDRFGASALRRFGASALRPSAAASCSISWSCNSRNSRPRPRRTRRPLHRRSPRRRTCARSRATSRYARRCLRTCRASGWCCPARQAARAAAGSWQSWARPSPKRWNRSRAPTR